jgi:Holliday junction resolvasome RuvABC ATP-dependent DNA helicase subunit
VTAVTLVTVKTTAGRPGRDFDGSWFWMQISKRARPKIMDKSCKLAIERWVPSSWKEIVGNSELKEHLRDVLWSIRVREDPTGHNTLVYGPSRSGKTASLKLFMRCLLCHQLDRESLDPCSGDCPSCKDASDRFGRRGIEQQVHGVFVHCKPIDCTAMTEADLRDELAEMRGYHGVRAVYLDEIHRLARRNMDEQLLKQMEEKDFIWLASAISVNGLEDAFLNRFSTKIRTELPTFDELAVWLAERCRGWELGWDHEDTLIRLAERANGVPGLTLQVVARADKKRTRLLTRALVERHRFTCDD